MQALIQPMAMRARATRHVAIALTVFLTLAVVATGAAIAAGTTGVALKAAFDMLNDIAAGYGRQLLVLIAFVVAAVGWWAVNATSIILKFIGYIIFLGVALGAAMTLSGAVV